MAINMVRDCHLADTANVSDRTTDWNSIDWKNVNRVVRNLRQRIFKAAANGELKRVKSLQWLMLTSYANRLQSVRKVTQVNKGKNTPGVDNVLVKTAVARGKLVDQLKTFRPVNVLPAKRSYIPKGKKKRPLGIPVIKDRAMQAVVKNALEPEWESRFESISYGFRPRRSCQDAIQRIFLICRGGKALFVLDADVRSAFDKIRHDKILEFIGDFPGKKYVEAWLKAGYVELGQLHVTQEGTPQGGVISPLLANIALHGMEEALGIRYSIFQHGKEKGRVRCLSTIRIVRYADDFVVICLTEADAEWAKVRLGEFLHERGLEYSEEKTRITDMDTGFNFLGFNIRRYKSSNTKTGYKLLIKPSKESQKKVIDKLKQVWSELNGYNVISVLKKINPIIRGQANYYRTAVSKEIFSKWDHYLFFKQRKYVRRMHPKKSWKWRRNQYWGSFKKDSFDRWMFGDKKSKAFMLRYSHFPIERHILVRGYASPDNPMERDYWEKRELRKGNVIPKYRALVKKQKNRCPVCNDWLSNGEGLEIDHIIPKQHGGDDTITNKQLLHYYCHMQKTAQEKRKRYKLAA